MSTIDNKFTEKHSLKEQIKLDSQRTEALIKCPTCGHTMPMYFVDRKVCSHCGFYVYKDKVTEFRYNLLKEMKK